MITATILDITARPWGLEYRIRLTDTETGLSDTRTPFFKSEPTPEELEAEIEKQKGFFVASMTPPVVQPSPEIAAEARIVLSALIGSGQLPSDAVQTVEQLNTAIEQATGTRAELGQAATEKVLYIIAKLRESGTAEMNALADQVEQALKAVQAIWRAE